MSKKTIQYSDSSEYSDSYQDALISSLSEVKNKNTDIVKKKKQPTDIRIDFVKNILNGNKLSPMIDFDNCNTETSTNTELNKKLIDAEELFMSMNVKLKYLKSGTTGHTFKALSKENKNIAFAVKVCAYPKDEYGQIDDLKRPENAELRVLKLLSYFVIKKHTPHFVLPVGTFNTSIKHFVRIPKDIINLNDKKNEIYRKFIKRYSNGEFEKNVSVLISEWCNGGDLLDYIRKNYKKMTRKDWKIIFFQILFTLARVHTVYSAFRHNDMKANNILVQITNVNNIEENYTYRYAINDYVFYIPDINIQIKIWDFDFACINGIIENNKVNSDWTKKINIKNKENKYYDMHYFFNTLINKRFFPQFYDGGAPPEIVDFIHRVIPLKYRNGSTKVNKKGRIQVDTEFTTPYKVITEDPLFEKFRFRT